MTSKVLTAQAVAKVRPTDYVREVPDAGAPGLYLIIYPSGKKSWAYRFRRPGDRRSAKLVLGSVNTTGDANRDPDPVIGGHLTLAGAHRLVAALRHRLAMGRDPAADHQADRHKLSLLAADTFAVAASDFLLQHAKVKTRRWRDQARLLGLREAGEGLELIDKGLADRWRNKPLSEIDADVIFRLIEEVRNKGVPGLELRNSDPSEPRALGMFAVLSKMFNWLADKRRIKVSPLAQLKRPSAGRARDRVLGNDEIVRFWRAADVTPKPFAAMLRLLLLTGARLNEGARMERVELSADLATWTIPSTRTKNHRTHVVPLPPLARSLLSGLEQTPECRFVFTTNQRAPVGGFSKWKRRLDAKMALDEPYRFHDLRRTAATGMAEIGIAPHIVEAILNHTSGHKASVAGIYNRAAYAPEKKAALERWAAHVEALVSGRAASVVSIKQRGRARRDS
jgi:integrase